MKHWDKPFLPKRIEYLSEDIYGLYDDALIHVGIYGDDRSNGWTWKVSGDAKLRFLYMVQVSISSMHRPCPFNNPNDIPMGSSLLCADLKNIKHFIIKCMCHWRLHWIIYYLLKNRVYLWSQCFPASNHRPWEYFPLF